MKKLFKNINTYYVLLVAAVVVIAKVFGYLEMPFDIKANAEDIKVADDKVQQVAQTLSTYMEVQEVRDEEREKREEERREAQNKRDDMMMKFYDRLSKQKDD